MGVAGRYARLGRARRASASTTPTRVAKAQARARRRSRRPYERADATGRGAVATDTTDTTDTRLAPAKGRRGHAYPCHALQTRSLCGASPHNTGAAGPHRHTMPRANRLLRLCSNKRSMLMARRARYMVCDAERRACSQRHLRARLVDQRAPLRRLLAVLGIVVSLDPIMVA